jgi:hypothetical protein
MLREVGKIYFRAFQMIFRYPQFLILSALHLMITWAVSYLTRLVKSYHSLTLVVLEGWIGAIVSLTILVGFPLAFILMIYRVETGIGTKEIFQEMRKRFWGYVRQYLAGTLISLAYSISIFCLVAISVFMNDKLFFAIIVPLWLLVFGYLSFGAVTLAQRIFLDGGEGAFKNSIQGLRALNGNFVFFLILYFTYTLISISHFLSGYLIGSAITGVDLLSVPVTSFYLFVENALAATQTPFVTVWSLVLGIILFPLYIIVPTLAYLHVKNGNASAYVRRRQLSTEN